MTVPRFLADEDLRFEIVLASRRFEPMLEFDTVVNLGLSGQPDPHVLEYAHVHGWILVSHDVKTMKAAAESRIRERLPVNGLFLAPQNRPTRSIAESLVIVFSASEAEEWKDRIVYLPL